MVIGKKKLKHKFEKNVVLLQVLCNGIYLILLRYHALWPTRDVCVGQIMATNRIMSHCRPIVFFTWPILLFPSDSRARHSWNDCLLLWSYVSRLKIKKYRKKSNERGESVFEWKQNFATVTQIITVCERRDGPRAKTFTLFICVFCYCDMLRIRVIEMLKR